MNRALVRSLLPALLVSSLSFAQGTTGPSDPETPKAAKSEQTPDTKAAQELLGRYLTAVKAKKWADAKKFIHPDTLKVIAERKKRLGKEDHPMAPWYQEKISSYLKEFKVTDSRPAAQRTVVVETSEDNYQVEEKGVSEGDLASYLVGRKGGHWYVVDKKRNETFSNDSIKLGYKGFFDAMEK